MRAIKKLSPASDLDWSKVTTNNTAKQIGAPQFLPSNCLVSNTFASCSAVTDSAKSSLTQGEIHVSLSLVCLSFSLHQLHLQLSRMRMYVYMPSHSTRVARILIGGARCNEHMSVYGCYYRSVRSEHTHHKVCTRTVTRRMKSVSVHKTRGGDEERNWREVGNERAFNGNTTTQQEQKSRAGAWGSLEPPSA